MDRKTKFLNLNEHLWYGKLYKKLNKAEIAIAIDFIENNSELDPSSFELAVNRMFLNKEKPKRWAIITELLAVSK